MSRFVLCFAGLSSHHCFKMFVLWRRIPAGSRCRCLQGDSVSAPCCVWCCLCLLPVHEMIHLLLDFPFCIADFINPQKTLSGSCFSTLNSGLTINNLLWVWSSSLHCWVPRTKCQQQWEKEEKGLEEWEEGEKENSVIAFHEIHTFGNLLKYVCNVFNKKH